MVPGRDELGASERAFAAWWGRCQGRELRLLRHLAVCEALP
jgi:hypothetical protein